MEVQPPVVDCDVWFACAAPYSGRLPAVGSRVYYFPHGHAEQCGVPLTPQFPYRHCFPCTVTQLVVSVDGADEIHATISLQPGDRDDVPHRRAVPAGCSPGPDQREFCFFEKQLSLSDVFALTLPESGANDVLPPLQRNLNAADQPLLFIKDLRGVRWKFRHVLSDHDGRHLLTTGWGEFVVAKRLVYGDSVVFMRRPDGELLLGVRRRGPDGSHPGPESSHATTAARLASRRWSLPFDVTYYPRVSTDEFVVRREVVDASPAAFAPGVPVRLLMNPDDTRRRTEMVFGTVRADDSLRAWRKLELAKRARGSGGGRSTATAGAGGLAIASTRPSR
uniref:Auxin response factor n=1 Tax=Oryza glumipatula TaxID=40148 RepID=A0A0E0AGM5_9ORYZ